MAARAQLLQRLKESLQSTYESDATTKEFIDRLSSSYGPAWEERLRTDPQFREELGKQTKPIMEDLERKYGIKWTNEADYMKSNTENAKDKKVDK